VDGVNGLSEGAASASGNHAVLRLPDPVRT